MAVPNSTVGERVKDTAGSQNLEVPIERTPEMDEMETILHGVVAEIGLQITHTTVLGRKRYPGNRHWHFKRDRDEKGCLDLTYWPAGKLLWITMRHMEPPWVREMGPLLGKALGGALEAPR